MPVLLTIVRQRFAFVNSTWDLETTSRGFAKLSNVVGWVVQHFFRKISNIAEKQEMMRMGPEKFDQILQAIEPHICKKCTKMGGDSLIGCLIYQY